MCDNATFSAIIFPFSFRKKRRKIKNSVSTKGNVRSCIHIFPPPPPLEHNSIFAMANWHLQIYYARFMAIDPHLPERMPQSNRIKLTTLTWNDIIVPDIFLFFLYFILILQFDCKIMLRHSSNSLHTTWKIPFEMGNMKIYLSIYWK